MKNPGIGARVWVAGEDCSGWVRGVDTVCRSAAVTVDRDGETVGASWDQLEPFTVPLVDELGDDLRWAPGAGILEHAETGDRLAYMAGDTFHHAITGDLVELR